MRRKAEVGPIYRLPFRVLPSGDFLTEYPNRDTADFAETFAVWLVEEASVRPFRLLLIGKPKPERKKLILKLRRLEPAKQVEHLNSLLKKTEFSSDMEKLIRKLQRLEPANRVDCLNRLLNKTEFRSELEKLILRLQRLESAKQVVYLNRLLRNMESDSRAWRALQNLGAVHVKSKAESTAPSFHKVRLTSGPLIEVPLAEVQQAYQRRFPPPSKITLKLTREQECGRDLIIHALKESSKLRLLADSASQLWLIVDSLLAIDSSCHKCPAKGEVFFALDSPKRILMVVDQRQPGFLRKYLARILAFETYRTFGRSGAGENHSDEWLQLASSANSEGARFCRRISEELFCDDKGWASSESSYRRRLASALLAVHAVDSGALVKFLCDLVALWKKIYAPGSTWRRNRIWGWNWEAICRGDVGKMDGISETVLKKSGKENVTVTDGETESRRRSRDLKMVSAKGFKKMPRHQTPAAH